MTGTLQKRFVVTSMIAVSALILVMLGTINIVNYVVNERQTQRTFDKLSENVGHVPSDNQMNQGQKPLGDGHPPKFEIFPYGGDNALFAQYFLVRFDLEGNICYVDCGKADYVSEEEAKTEAAKVYNSGRSKGRKGYFRYVLLDSEDGQGRVVIFLNISAQISSILRVFIISAVIGFLGWCLMLLLVTLLSRKAILPVAENIEKQRQFVTNAGHEIKTPLAIILANVDAMELHNGENKWSRNIRTQTARLSGLMQNLLLLSKMDEGSIKWMASDICVSELLKEAVDVYIEPAGLRGIQVHADIEPGIVLHADKERMVQLISIMLDNAVKYTDEEGDISVLLKTENKHIKMQFANTSRNLPQDNPERLFERFYRGDCARTQKNGGYGIGLSVAKAIVESLHGSIRVECRKNEKIVFIIDIG